MACCLDFNFHNVVIVRNWCSLHVKLLLLSCIIRNVIVLACCPSLLPNEEAGFLVFFLFFFSISEYLFGKVVGGEIFLMLIFE